MNIYLCITDVATKKGICALNNVKVVVKFQPTGFKNSVSLNMIGSTETRDSRTVGLQGACACAPSNFARIFVGLYFLKS